MKIKTAERNGLRMTTFSSDQGGEPLVYIEIPDDRLDDMFTVTWEDPAYDYHGKEVSQRVVVQCPELVEMGVELEAYWKYMKPDAGAARSRFWNHHTFSVSAPLSGCRTEKSKKKKIEEYTEKLAEYVEDQKFGAISYAKGETLNHIVRDNEEAQSGLWHSLFTQQSAWEWSDGETKKAIARADEAREEAQAARQAYHESQKVVQGFQNTEVLSCLDTEDFFKKFPGEIVRHFKRRLENGQGFEPSRGPFSL